MIKVVIYLVACMPSFLQCIDLPEHAYHFENMGQCLDQRPAIIRQHEEEWKNSSYPIVMAKCHYLIPKN